MAAEGLRPVIGPAVVLMGAAVNAVPLFRRLGLVGVLLSGSSYRHQIESDIEPFKGLLRGLFFLAVGMSLNLAVVAAEWPLLLAMLVVYVLVKAVAIYATARAFGGANSPALRRTVMFAQGGEFAFVLYTAALAGEVIDARENAIFSTVLILSMAITPLILIAADQLLRAQGAALDGVETADGLRGQVLVIGFGRFGQIALQMLLARRAQVSVIENNADRIRKAARFGFKVYYGDGTRLDILHTSGAQAQVVLICVDDRREVSAIVELIQHEFPNAAVLARSYDRGHSMELIRAGADFEIRETVESALLMGAEGLRRLGWDEAALTEALDDIRRRDAQRLAEQVQGDIMAGQDKMLTAPVPEPLIPAPLAQKGDS